MNIDILIEELPDDLLTARSTIAARRLIEEYTHEITTAERAACARDVCPAHCGNGHRPIKGESPSAHWWHDYTNEFGAKSSFVCAAAAIWERGREQDRD